MITFLWVVLWILALVALIRLHLAFWTRKFRVHRRADQVHYALTEDGWSLAVHRYLPRQKLYKEPILLCHGMGANRFNFDLAADRSLARTLADGGFDVWSLELRSHGLSSRPSWFTSFDWRFDFDDHLLRDAPAALALVREQCAGEKVFWVGHSMGGMIGAAHMGGAAGEELAGLVAIASPMALQHSRGISRIRMMARLATLFRVVAFRPLARFFSPFLGRAPGFMVDLFYHPGGMRPAVVRRCLVNLVENASTALLKQLLAWARTGEYTSPEAARDIFQDLSKVRAPVLLLGAERDNMASPESIMPAYEQLGTRDKQLRIFGIDRGDDVDFGHGDVLLGEHAAEIVYPELVDWLVDRARSEERTETTEESVQAEQQKEDG